MNRPDIDWYAALNIAELIAAHPDTSSAERRLINNLANAYLRLLNESAQLRFAVDAKKELS